VLDAEITESIMMNKEDNINDVFMLFNDLGITVSIDDFGSVLSNETAVYLSKNISCSGV